MQHGGCGHAVARRLRSTRPGTLCGALHPDFLFIFSPNPSEPSQPVDWGRTEEVRIHQRMFRPQDILPTDSPVPGELWLDAIAITLAPNGAFAERPEYYASPTNPGGLDSATTRVWGVDYSTSVLWITIGDTDYQVTGTAYFVIVENRTLNPDAPGAFLLYRWQDLGYGLLGEGQTPASAVPATWTQVKKLYYSS